MKTGNQADTHRMGKSTLRLACHCCLPSHRKEKGRELPQQDLRAKFYEHYRKEAEEYDREFMKKRDEDLNTTLIFVGCTHRLGARVLT